MVTHLSLRISMSPVQLVASSAAPAREKTLDSSPSRASIRLSGKFLTGTNSGHIRPRATFWPPTNSADSLLGEVFDRRASMLVTNDWPYEPVAVIGWRRSNISTKDGKFQSILQRRFRRPPVSWDGRVGIFARGVPIRMTVRYPGQLN
jgi:hypothetical protein